MFFEINMIDIADVRYPGTLKDIAKPPDTIYYAGVWDSLLFHDCVGVVGSRKISPYGVRAVDCFVKDFVLSGSTVISGFMYGVDMHAHEAAIARGGKTIAVLPHGISVPIPEQYRHIAHQIIESGGLLISMFDPLQECAKWTFPKRNEWVAGLVHRLFVVEAAKNSGSLITAGFAKKYNRPVYAVPGSIFSETSCGCNQLISQGARVALPHVKTNSDVDPVVKVLSTAPFSIDELMSVLNLNYEDTTSKLSSLLISKKIYESGGKFYVY